jgi:hypothetical protein
MSHIIATLTLHFNYSVFYPRLFINMQEFTRLNELQLDFKLWAVSTFLVGKLDFS